MAQATSQAESRSIFSSSPLYLIASAALILLFGAALYAHLHIASAGDTYTGPLALLDRVFDIFLASALVGVGFCVGRKLLRFWALSFASVAEEVSFSVMLGTGVIALAVLGLGLAGLLKLLPVSLLALLFVGATYKEVVRLFAASREMFANATATKTGKRLVLLFCLLLGILLLRAATPPHDFDDAIYHLSVTDSFVRRGQVYPIIDNSAGNISFLIQMIYAICLLAKADIAAKIYCLFLTLICGLSLYAFAARFFSRRTGVIALFAFFAAGMVVEVAITTRIDVSLACMVWVATYAMILYFESQRRGWLYVSAMLAGFALGIKYTAGVWLFLLGLMFLIESFRKKTSPVFTTLRLAVVYASIAMALASPWFIKNWIWFHNPVYPFITGEVADYSSGQPKYFMPEDELKLEAHFENARSANPSLVEERKQVLEKTVSERVIQSPPHFWEYFTKPDIYSFPESSHYPNYLFLLTPLLIFVPKHRWVTWLALLSIAFFIFMTAVSWFPRYLLPLYPPLTLISAYVLTALTDRVGEKGTRVSRIFPARLLVVIVLAITVGFIAVSSWVLAARVKSMDFISGQTSRRNFMSVAFYYPPIDFINHNLPEQARVMLLGAQMSYGLKRDYIADISLEATEWRRLLIRNNSLAAVHNDLKQRGVTHLLVSYDSFRWGATRSGKGSVDNLRAAQSGRPDYYVQLRNWATLDQYSSNFLEPVYSDKFGFILYRLK
jgi:hypothetical protein